MKIKSRMDHLKEIEKSLRVDIARFGKTEHPLSKPIGDALEGFLKTVNMLKIGEENLSKAINDFSLWCGGTKQ